MEEWRTISGQEGRYEVSNRGQVRRIGGRTLKPVRGAAGYMNVTLYPTPRDIHRLVAEAFLERPDGATCVRHLDGNPENNDVTNLAWGTVSDNMRDRVRHGTDRNAAKTECPAGHPYNNQNTRVSRNGHRACRACGRDANRRYRARQKQRSMA